LLSPCIVIKVGGLMPCSMHSHSYIKLGLDAPMNA
jgi:hypothetical protein